MKEKRQTLTLPSGSGTITEMAWSPDEKKLAAVTDRGWLHVWYTTTRVHFIRKKLDRASLLTVAWARQGHSLAVGGENGSLYRVSRLSNLLVSRHVFPEPVTRISWSSSPLGRCLVVSGHDLIVMDERGTQMRFHYASTLLDAAWSANGRTLAVACADGLVEVIDADRRDLRLALAIIPDSQCLSWHKDGLQLAVGTASGHVHLCDPRSGQQGETFPLSCSPIHALKWGSPGLFVRSAQGDLALWNEREAQASPYQPASPSSAFVLNPQGTRLATVQSGKVTLVNL